jgi:chromosome segregation ATPase
MIETGIILAATAPYWVPILVGLGATLLGSITTALAFFAGRRARRRASAERDLSHLRADQQQRDQDRRENIQDYVALTKEQLDDLRQQSSLQQQKMSSSNQVFDENIVVFAESTRHLEREAEALHSTLAYSAENMVKISTELEQLKQKFALVNEQLQQTQDALDKKEHDLNHSLMHLDSLQQRLTKETAQSQLVIHNLSQQLTTLRSVEQVTPEAKPQATEILTLQEKNQSLASSIQTLESTLLRLSDTLKTAQQHEAVQADKIQQLLSENKRLKRALHRLSGDVELLQGQSSDRESPPRSSMRMFG